jgi:hypothetical protein
MLSETPTGSEPQGASSARERGNAGLGGWQSASCETVSAQDIMRAMNPRALYWWQMIMLAAVSLLLSAVVTWCLAYFADHILWE